MEQRSISPHRRDHKGNVKEMKNQHMLMELDGDASGVMDEDVGDETGGFRLPTSAERAEELHSGWADLAAVQRRIRGCTRVLGRFSELAEPER